jgi:hypothetical protein
MASSTSVSSLRPDFVSTETSSLSAASAEVLKLIVVTTFFGFVKV